MTMIKLLIFSLSFLITIDLYSVDLKVWAANQIALKKTCPDWTINENFEDGKISFGVNGRNVNLDFLNKKVTWSGFTPDENTRLFWDAVVLKFGDITPQWTTTNFPFPKFFPCLNYEEGNKTQLVIIFHKNLGAKKGLIRIETGMVVWNEFANADLAADMFWKCVLGEYPELLNNFK